MLVVHHLNNSRSQRVLWLLEELGVPYRIQHHQRNAKTMLAPPELKVMGWFALAAPGVSATLQRKLGVYDAFDLESRG